MYLNVPPATLLLQFPQGFSPEHLILDSPLFNSPSFWLLVPPPPSDLLTVPTSCCGLAKVKNGRIIMSFWFGHDIPLAWILINLYSSLKFSLGSTKTLVAFFKVIVVTVVNDSCLEMIEFVFYVCLRPSHGKLLNKIMVCVGVCMCMCVGHMTFTQMETVRTKQHIVSFKWLGSINQGSVLF